MKREYETLRETKEKNQFHMEVKEFFKTFVLTKINLY